MELMDEQHRYTATQFLDCKPTGRVDTYLAYDIEDAVRRVLYCCRLTNVRAFVGPTGRVVHASNVSWVVVRAAMFLFLLASPAVAAPRGRLNIAPNTALVIETTDTLGSRGSASSIRHAGSPARFRQTTTRMYAVTFPGVAQPATPLTIANPFVQEQPVQPVDQPVVQQNVWDDIKLTRAVAPHDVDNATPWIIATCVVSVVLLVCWFTRGKK